jgi:mannose/fructose/N-acetylgalactosamine-specific phosphotransferase system component IIC
MKLIDLLEHASPIDVAKAYLSTDEVNERLDQIGQFINNHRHVSLGIINAVIIRTIQATQDEGFFNYPYLAKVYRTIETAGITSTAAAVAFLENKQNHRHISGKKKKVVFVPDYMSEFEELLEKN